MKKQDDFIMLPIIDFCFKELMTVEKVRKGFIAAVLGIRPEEIKSVRLLPTILRKGYPEEKYGILDVRVLLNNTVQIDMEMQVAYFDYWAERTVFYLSKMYVEQIEEGQSYGELKKCVSISILNFEQFPGVSEFASCFQLREKKRGSLYTDKLEFHVIELPKLNSEGYPENALLNWAKFLHGKSRKEFEKMAEKDEYIKEAYKTLDKISMDREKRMEYEIREKAIRDYNHQMYHAEKRGLKKGMEQGLEQGLEQGIQALIEDYEEEGFSKEKILLKLQKRFYVNEEKALSYWMKYSLKKSM